MYRCFFKRCLSFLGAFLGLLLLGWLILIVMVFLHFANKGAGAFFTQERPGKNAKIYRVIKFKTMTDERDAEGNLLPDAQRLTKVGRIVRSLSIDELPQLINILKGDMAFIGPRPLLPEYLSWYTERERLRHTVRPGMSGWAQVNGRNNLSWDAKLELDAYYVEHLSLTMDIRVILKTIVNVLGGKDVVVVPGSIGGKLDVERKKKIQNGTEKNKI